jgi:multicomponent Na+:H+ antiporter subunit G
VSVVIDALSWALLVAGSFFLLVGGLGVLFFPGFYVRIHAAGVTDSAGATLILSGLMMQSGLSPVTLKLILVLLFLLVTSPTASHALVKAAYARGLKIELPIPGRAIVPGPEHQPKEEEW